MPTNHVVQQGDSALSLSEQYGLFALTIWEDPANAALREQRDDMNILLPGDVVVIPDKRIKYETRETGKEHPFRRKGLPALFRLQVFDRNIPRANQTYTLSVDGTEMNGTTDGQGILEHYLPAQSKEGELLIGEDQFRVRLQFGHLDPVNETAGIQKRLNNLGHECGEPDGEMNAATKAALRAFQRAHGLQESGEADTATRAKLKEIHDNPNEFPHRQPDGGAAP